MRLNFTSGGLRCAASLFRPTDMPGVRAPCVVMAHGFTGTRDQLTLFAEAFARAGLAVLTFAILLSGRFLRRFLGEIGLGLLTRVLGLLVAAIGMQFLITGGTEVIVETIAPKLMRLGQ